MKKTRKQFRQVVIEEFYSQEAVVVYWNWRFAGTEEWNKVLTGYADIPWVVANIA